MKKGQVSKTIFNHENYCTLSMIIIQIEVDPDQDQGLSQDQDQYHFDDLISVTIYGNNNPLLQTTPLISQNNHFKRRIQTTKSSFDRPIYTIVMEPAEMFSLSRIDVLEFELISDPSITCSGQVHMWILEQNMLVSQDGTYFFQHK